MIIEMRLDPGKVTLGARVDLLGIVAMSEGATIEEAVKLLISQFAEMQASAIKALNDSGLIRYVKQEDMS